ncbi:MAG: class II aldolase/adducin family protein [Alphaproteobacteria bacterium]|nr:class II aldolase/adducin family protein [Alphaproteobacteria bacterium]
MASNSDDAARALVAKSCRMIGGLELTKAATGHVSQRAEDGQHILIRARGADEVGVRYTTAEEVIMVDMKGRKVDGPDGLAVPQEVFIHTWLYNTRPEVKSVVHVHPPTVVLFTICDKPLMPLYGAYDPSSLYLWLEGIPTYGRSVTISNDELGKDFTDAMGDKRTCLMRGHGITTAGASVEEATVTAIKLNELAEMNYRAHLLGDPKPIPEADLDDYRRRLEKRGGFSASPHGQSSWRYYERLSGA